MKKLNILSKTDGWSSGHTPVTLGTTVGSPSVHRRGTLLKLLSMLVLMVFGFGQMWGAEGDEHPFTDVAFSTQLNNGANISDVTIANPGYPVKKIVANCRYNKTAGGVTISITVGGETFGSSQTHNASSTVDLTFTDDAMTGDIVLSFTNNCAYGTGKGTFYLNSITLTEGASAGGGDPVDPTITFNNGSVDAGYTLDLSTLFTSNSNGEVTYSITEGDSYASIDGSILTGVAAGSVTVQASQAATASYNAATANSTITVNAHTVTPGKYDILFANAFWGTSGTGQNAGHTASGIQNDITVSINGNSGTQNYINDNQTRIYGSHTLTFSVPSGYVLKQITGLGTTSYNSISVASGSTGTITNRVWTGSDNSVTFDLGGRTDFTTVSVTYAVYEAPTACATPTFSPAAGEYEEAQNVTISCATEDATIYYTIDGTNPKESVTKSEYTGAISVTEAKTIKAYATKTGLLDSEVAEAAYTFVAGPEVTLDFTTNDEWEFPTEKTVDADEYTAGGYTITVAGTTGKGYNFDTDHLFLGQNGAYITLPTFDFPVSKVVCVGVETGSGSVSFNLFEGDDAVSTAVTSCKIDQTFEIDAEDQASNKTYTIKLTNANNARFAKIKVYRGVEPAVKKPVISGDENFVTSTSVTISCETSGATIYYTTDGSNPKVSGSTTPNPFSLTAGATVKAAAKLGDDWSAVAEKTFTKVDALSTMEAVQAAMPDDGTENINIIIEDWIVTASKEGQSQVWIANADNTKGILLYQSGHGFATGDKLNGVVLNVGITKFNTAPELTSFKASDVTVTTADAITPNETTIDAITTAIQGTVITLKDLTYSSANSNFSDGEHTIAIDTRLYTPTLVNDATYDLTGVVMFASGGAIKLIPRKAEDVVKTSADPLPEVDGLAALKAEVTGASYLVNLTNAVVTLVSGNNAFIEDATAGALIFYSGHGLVAGDKLNGAYQVTTADYQGKFEITAIEAQQGAETTPDAEIPVTTLTLAQLNANFAAYESMRIKIEGAEVTGAIAGSDRNGEISDGGENTLAVYASVENTITLEEDKVVNIIGYPGFHTVNQQIAQQLTVWAQADIVDVTPAPKYTVRFWNTAEGWSSVNAHVWNNDGNVTTWPGEATTFAAGWNEFKVEEGNSLLFCKADGSAQTVNIENVTADACYVLTGEADGSGHLEVALDNECAARLYVAGNTELTGENWNAAGSRLVNGSITFSNVPEGDHELKVTNGSWNWTRGYLAFDSENSNVTNWGEDNVGFTTTSAKDITIAYDEANNKITVTAVDYVAPVYKAIVVEYEGDYYAMTTSLDGEGFTPLAVKVDGEGNILVQSEAERNSILWKFTEGEGTATFQDADNKYLAHTGNSTGLTLQAANVENPEVWTWDAEKGCYYVGVVKNTTTTNRSFFYQGGTANKFKNYSLANLGETGYSGAPTFYAEAKVIVSTTATLKFFAPVAWESVKAYTWEGTNTGDHPMTAVAEGSRWFQCEIEKGVPFLIHNGDLWNGLNQTANIAAINEDKCFAWTAATDEDGKIVATEITTCEMNYYIAGDAALIGGEYTEWPADGRALSNNNDVSFSEVAANTYHFKITNGSWAWALGDSYVDETACQNVTIEETDASGNVVFTIANPSDITIAYNPATEKISVVATAVTPKEYYTKVTSPENLTAGYYLIVSEDNLLEEHVALNGGLSTLDATNNVIDVEIVTGKGIEVTEATNAAAFFIDPEIGTIKSAKGQFIGLTGTNNALKQSGDIYAFENAFSFDEDGNAVIICGSKKLCYNSATGQNRFRYFTNDQQAIQLYKKAEAAKASPKLAFVQSEVQGLKGNVIASNLTNEHNVPVTYVSSATTYASVDEEGNVTLKKEGNVTIYAVTTGDETYRESYAKYVVTINDFGSYERDGLTEGRYGTICLPNGGTIEGATLFDLDYYDGAGTLYLLEVNGNAMIAGRPYIFLPSATTITVTYTDNANEAAGSFHGLVGSYTEETVAIGIGDEANYILWKNAYYLVDSDAKVGANRAYIHMASVPKEPTPQVGQAPRRRIAMTVNGKQTPTGFDELNASEAPAKKVINGQLFILRGEKIYDATGRLVK